MEDRYIYRGKRFNCTLNNGWVQGSLVVAKNGYFITNILDVKFICQMSEDVFDKVDPTTIGQCTGLKDKHGKLIFEGDIVKVTKGHPNSETVGIVKFGGYQHINADRHYHNGDLGFYIEWAKAIDRKTLRNDILYWVYDDYSEVVGNKHDSPELMEKEQ